MIGGGGLTFGEFFFSMVVPSVMLIVGVWLLTRSRG